MRFLLPVAAFSCLLALSLNSFAQAPSTPTPAQSAIHDHAKGTPAVSVVAANAHATTTAKSELDQPITVVVNGLQEWIQAGNKPSDLRLFLSGQMITKNAPTLISARDEYVMFQLEIDPQDRDTWVQILYEARRAKDHSIPLSIGPQDSKQPLDSQLDLELQVYPTYTPFVILLLVVLLGSMIVLGQRSDLLREITNPPPLPARPPYSFGRAQMAFWFYIVIAAYFYVWLITGEYNTLTNSVLALIGISAGTGLAAVFVNKQKLDGIRASRISLETTQAALTARIKELETATPVSGSSLDQELQEKKNSLHQTQASLAALPAWPAPAVSNGLVRDLLSSGEGVSFHRFQMAVWTIVFGIIFIRSVYRDLTMPNFDASLLGLMGISSGTYLGFKIPEETPK
jgi:hypothetical protein